MGGVEHRRTSSSGRRADLGKGRGIHKYAYAAKSEELRITAQLNSEWSSESSNRAQLSDRTLALARQQGGERLSFPAACLCVVLAVSALRASTLQPLVRCWHLHQTRHPLSQPRLARLLEEPARSSLTHLNRWWPRHPSSTGHQRHSPQQGVCRWSNSQSRSSWMPL